MPPANGNLLLINPPHMRSYCYSCSRWFNTAAGALNHARNAQTHNDEWCERCERLFVSASALDQHLANLSQHHICEHCDDDLNSASDLDDHIAEQHRPRIQRRAQHRGRGVVQQVLQ